MNIIRALANPLTSWIEALKLELQLVRVLSRFPSLKVQKLSNWSYNKLAAIEIGEGPWVGPFTEVTVYSKSPRSNVAGKLVLGKGSIVSAGCNIRASGGVIAIGANSGIGPNSVLVAANHAIGPDKIYLRCEWDEERTGVTIGDNCWIAANCVILPGVTVGDNAIIGAGSIVNKSVPANEIWAGAPARFIKKIT